MHYCYLNRYLPPLFQVSQLCLALKVPHVITGVSPLKRLEAWLSGPSAKSHPPIGIILDDLEVSGSTRAWSDLLTQLRILLGSSLPTTTLIVVARQPIFAESDPPPDGHVVVEQIGGMEVPDAVELLREELRLDATRKGPPGPFAAPGALDAALEATAKRCRGVPGLMSLLGKNVLHGTVKLSDFLEAPLAEGNAVRGAGRNDPSGVAWDDVIMLSQLIINLALAAMPSRDRLALWSMLPLPCVFSLAVAKKLLHCGTQEARG